MTDKETKSKQIRRPRPTLYPCRQSVSLERTIYEQIEALADRTGKTCPEIMREAIADGLPRLRDKYRMRVKRAGGAQAES